MVIPLSLGIPYKEYINPCTGGMTIPQYGYVMIHGPSDSSWLYHIPGWWYTYPSEKYDFVSWDDDIPNIWKIIHSCSKPPTSKSYSDEHPMKLGTPMLQCIV